MAALLDVVKKGSTDRSVTLRIIDSGDGTPETGVVYNTSGIDLWYRREGAAKVSITEATLSALTDAHADGGFLHIGDGEYRLDLPDAAFAAGANHVDIGGTVTGMIVIGGRVRLVNYDPEDAVRLGLTALPNAAAEAAGGLYTRGTGAGQINQDANGRIDAHLNNAAHGGAAAVLTLERLIATSVTSNQAAVKLTGNGSAGGLELLGGSTGPGATATAGAFANTGGMILTGKGSGPGLGLLPGPTGHGLYALSGSSSGDAIRGEKVGSGNAFNLVGSVTVVVETFLNNLINRLGAFTGTGNNTVLGFFLALFKKDATAPSDVGGTFDPTTDSLEAQRDNTDTQLTAIDDYLDTEVAAIKAKTDNLPADPADASDIAALFATVNGKLDAIDDFLDTEIAAILADTTELADTVLADSVPADGSLGTLKQTLYEIRQFLFEASVSGTTVTSKKADGSTTLETFTTNSATAPTSITRSG